MYSIKQVSEMLDIPPVTLRAWESRYKAVTPHRTEAGYRIYSEENVADLRFLKEQLEMHHMNISHAVRLLQQQREERERERSWRLSMGEQTVMHTDDALEKMADQIYQTLYRFQGERANALIDFGFTMYGYDLMFYRVLVPILVRVGDAWECGKASVAQEHFMTQLISQRFYQFFHLFPIYPHLPKVLAMCPQGEHHEVGLLLFSLFLRKNGAEVLYLGANTPSEGLIEIIRDQQIDLVCMSITDPKLRTTADGLTDSILSQFPQMDFVLGGKGYETQKNPRYPDWIMPDGTEHWQEWFEEKYISKTRPDQGRS